MLKRKLRLPGQVKFVNKELTSTPLFIIKTKENGLSFNRISTLVSKKIDKRAVVRNRIRRLINSCIEELYNNLKQGHDMIIIVKNRAVGTDRKEFCKEIGRGLKRAGFMK